jgi:type I restriction enzyme R subunit
VLAVLFKLVRSKTKFWQMIGRGTRLCPNLFGPGQDKAFFFVFDYCQNLEYFGANAKGVEGSVQEPLSKKLFLRRLELLQEVRKEVLPVTDGQKIAAVKDAPLPYGTLDTELADRLHTEVEAMNLNNFLVRPKRRYVETYKDRKVWDTVGREQASEIGEHLAGLPAELDPEDITARQFDLLLLNLQLALLRAEPGLPRLQQRVRETAELLEEKGSIPLVAQQMPLIQEVQEDAFWQNVTLGQLESVRKRLRDLVKFIEKSGRTILYTDFEDEIGAGTEVVFTGLATSIDVAQYKKKVLAFLNAQREHPAILKLRFNQPLTRQDLAALQELLYTLGGEGSQRNFERAFGPQGSLGAFVRRLVDLDREAVQSVFADFLEGSRYTANQIRFVRQIIDYLTQNGVMEPARLYEQPFTYISATGIEGLFSEQETTAILAILGKINRNAGGYAASGAPGR